MTDRGAPRRPDLRALAGVYAVCRLPPGREAASDGGGFFSLTRTPAETSIVCREGDAPAGAEVEGGWRLLAVEGPLAFSEVGVLAALATPLAEAGVPIFVVSTFDTDYLMVKQERWPAARRALAAAGFRLRAAATDKP